jgi:hypothetical protein
MDRLAELARRHEELKRKIHSFRYPIHSRMGRFAMGVVYFTTPCVIGLGIMQWSNWIARGNLGEEGSREKLLAAAQKWQQQEKTAMVRAQTPVPKKLDVPQAREL